MATYHAAAVLLIVMSISRDFDEWMDERGLVPEAEIVPDHACQEFLPSDGVRISLASSSGDGDHREGADLEVARARVTEIFGQL